MLRIILIFIGLIFFSVPYVAHAEVVITEIMYDLDGADIDWVEVRNVGNEEVDMTMLKLLISNSTSNHGIKEYLGGPILGVGQHGVIVVTSVVAKYVDKWGNNENIFTSSFSLPNTAGKVEINSGDKNDPLSFVSYTSEMGAAGDGNSLQLINSTWLASEPTPGATNQVSSSSVSDDSEDDSTSSNNADDAEDSSSDTSIEQPKPKADTSTPKAKIISKTSAFTGQPLEIKADILKSGENVNFGRVYWNFGDGGSLEQTNNFETFSHTYHYPGDYIVSLEYYQNSFSKTPEAVAKMTIKVATTDVVISKVGDAKDFFIELSNNATSEIDVSGWFFGATNKIFVLPKNSVIAGKKHLTISGKTTGFVYGDQASLKLFSSTGEMIFDYSAPGSIPAPAATQTTTKAPAKISTPSVAPPKIPAETPAFLSFGGEDQLDGGEEIPAENMQASALGSEIASANTGNSYMPMILSLAFIGTSAGAVYFIRKRSSTTLKDPADNFTILED